MDHPIAGWVDEIEYYDPRFPKKGAKVFVPFFVLSELQKAAQAAVLGGECTSESGFPKHTFQSLLNKNI
jgi:hypothetical protein